MPRKAFTTDRAPAEDLGALRTKVRRALDAFIRKRLTTEARETLIRDLSLALAQHGTEYYWASSLDKFTKPKKEGQL